MPESAGPSQWDVIVPLKDLNRAKSRWQRSREDRAHLMFAFAQDVFAACLASPLVATVTTVGDDSWRRSLPPRVDYLEDPGGGLNAAVRAGISSRPADSSVVVMVADLPCADPMSVTALLMAATDVVTTGHWAAVPDAHDLGTTVLLGGTDLDPAFGSDSFARHLQAGALPLVSPGWQSLRLDVDDERDWDRALRAQVGPATQAALDEVGAAEGLKK